MRIIQDIKLKLKPKLKMIVKQLDSVPITVFLDELILCVPYLIKLSNNV